jgi:hypothetical protein
MPAPLTSSLQIFVAPLPRSSVIARAFFAERISLMATVGMAGFVHCGSHNAVVVLFRLPPQRHVHMMQFQEERLHR